jgi:prostatic aicd phosphatase
VLGDTATAFLQGLYPPSETATTQPLTNGSAILDPLAGYQYVLINGVPATAPDTIWIEGDTDCPAYTTASNEYYNSEEFLTTQTATQSFYSQFVPLLEGLLPADQVNFKNAYNIYDYFSVSVNHNATIAQAITTEQLNQLRAYANLESLNLVYNTSAPLRSIGGNTISGQILMSLNETVSGSNKNLKVTYYAGSYDVFLSFFGLAGLTQVNDDFNGLPEFASTMSFELHQPTESTATEDLFIRFGFRNGSDPSAPLNQYPLFGQPNVDLPWNDFVTSMKAQSIFTSTQWCNVCGASLPFCPLSLESTVAPSKEVTCSQPRVSSVGSGFIGACVTIFVIAVLEGFIALWWFKRSKGRKNDAKDALENLKATTSGNTSFLNASIV